MATGDERLSRLEAIHRQGFVRFVLVRGVLGWGLGTAILYSLFMWLVSGMAPGRVLPISLVVFPVLGVLWGATMWWVFERRYRQQVAGRAG